MAIVTAVIPARLGSMRLPRKILAEILGKPLIWHVWSRVCQAKLISQAYIATDSPEIQAAMSSFGGRVLMTSPNCRSGTERIASILDQLDDDLILNVQGDEPLIDPSMLDALVSCWQSEPCDLITPVYRITTIEDLCNPNVVKVARAHNGRALYFSRSPIPFIRDLPKEQWFSRHTFWGHIGVYGYRRRVLANYLDLLPGQLEQAEQLEQLRLLEAGYVFQTLETSYRPMAVDVAEDLDRVRDLMEYV